MKKFFLPLLALALTTTAVQSFAQTKNFAPVYVIGFDTPATNALGTTFYNSLADVFNNAVLKTLKYLYYNPNPGAIQFDQALSQKNSALNNAISLATKKIATDTQTVIDNTLKIGFTAPGTAMPTTTQQKIPAVASDNVVKNANDTTATASNSIFTSNQLQKPVPTTNQMFNASALIGTDNYSTATSAYNAESFIGHLKDIAPSPEVIRISAGQDFDVPIMNLQDPNKAYSTLDKINTGQAQELLENLNKDPQYRNYKKTYRSYIAARSAYVNNLYKIYYERTPLANGKSILQLKNELAHSRLNNRYYLAMQKATPATIERQKLFLLAQISAQLNQLYNQNERILLTNTLNGIATLASNSQKLSVQAQTIGKLVVQKYCAVFHENDADTVRNKNIKTCESQYGAGSIAAAITGQ